MLQSGLLQLFQALIDILALSLHQGFVCLLQDTFEIFLLVLVQRSVPGAAAHLRVASSDIPGLADLEFQLPCGCTDTDLNSSRHTEEVVENAPKAVRALRPGSERSGHMVGTVGPGGQSGQNSQSSQDRSAWCSPSEWCAV